MTEILNAYTVWKIPNITPKFFINYAVWKYLCLYCLTNLYNLEVNLSEVWGSKPSNLRSRFEVRLTVDSRGSCRGLVAVHTPGSREFPSPITRLAEKDANGLTKLLPSQPHGRFLDIQQLIEEKGA